MSLRWNWRASLSCRIFENSFQLESRPSLRLGGPCTARPKRIIIDYLVQCLLKFRTANAPNRMPIKAVTSLRSPVASSIRLWSGSWIRRDSALRTAGKWPRSRIAMAKRYAQEKFSTDFRLSECWACMMLPVEKPFRHMECKLVHWIN